MPFSKEEFRRVLGHFATGVTIVTTRLASGKPWGFTVNSFTSLSLTPPLILVCVDHGTESFRAMTQARYFAVNFLSENQEDLSRRFASKKDNRFLHTPCEEGAHGSPLIEGCLGYVACRKVASHAHGDHTIIIGEVLEAKALGGHPLLFYRGFYARLRNLLKPTRQ